MTRIAAAHPLARTCRVGALNRPVFTLRPISLAVCLVGAVPAAFGLPDGAVPTFGQASVSTPAPGQMSIVQGSQRAGLDWTSFSIAAGERVSVSQPATSSVLLNRVTGTDPSQIYGQLQSNGSVWLINPRGIVFGASSRVDVGGLVASTLSITAEDLASGRLQLGRGAGPAGELRSEGVISARDGGVVLVAPQLSHSGSIEARRVGLAAASEVLVDLYGDGLIFFNARNDGIEARLNQLGKVVTDGGTTHLQAAARAGFADTVLNLEGVVQARTLGTREGRIVVDGGAYGISRLAGQLDATGAGAGQRGGDVLVQGAKVLLTGSAVADASGAAGGGSVRVGGDFQGKNPEVRNAEMVAVLAGAQLSANATDAGNAGRVIVWSDEATRFYGAADAKGGPRGGDGGLVEVSGKNYLDFRGSSDRSALLGNPGTLLLDPTNITINLATPDRTGNDTGLDLDSTLLAFAAPGVNTFITAGAVVTQLGNGPVELQATDTITVASPVTFAGNTTSQLILRANNNVNVNSSVSVLGGVQLRADDDANGSGSVSISSAVTASSGTVLIRGGQPHSVSAAVSALTVDITGSTTLNAGALLSAPTISVTSGALTIGAANRISSTALIDLTNVGATLPLPNTNVVIGGLAGAGGVTLGNNASLTVGGSNTDTAFGGVISGGNVNSSLIKAGSGLLALTSANTYTGDTNVNGGVLSLGNGGATGTLSSSSAISIGGGTLRLNNSALTLTLTGSTIAGTGGAVDVRLGTLALGADSRISDNLSLVVSGGTFGLGTFNEALAGVQLTAGSITGTGTLTSGSAYEMQAGTASANLAGAVGLNKTTGDTVTLSGNNSYTGATAVSAGTLVASHASALGTTAGVTTVSSGATLEINNVNIGTETLTLAGVGVGGAGALIGTGAGAAAGGAITLSATTTVGGGGTLALGGPIGDGGNAFGLIKAGAGTVTLGGNNTYTGSTTVSAGTLALGVGERLANASSLVVSGGTLDLGGFTETVTGVQLIDGTIQNGTLISGSTFDMQAGTASAVLDGTAGLNKTTAGTVTLSGNNTYIGATTVSAGTLALAGANERLANASTLVASGGIFDLGGFTETVANVQLNGGTIQNGTLISSAAFDMRSGTASAILDGTAGLTKTTAGTVTLSGANTYTGATTVSAGTLALGTANERLADTSTLVVSGGTFDLGGFSETVAGVQLTGGTIQNG
ncbi:MAG: autotransporter-associated beta strand repeat-containing protein, partial [Rubrivivax sp.]|nr:autotransporter-associated beta strand repeat-containing protein [Rubrivivax sp.]